MTCRRMATVLTLTILTGCSPFSELQTARVLDKGQTEVTPYYSTTSLASGGSSTRLQTSYGVIAGVGLADHRKVDLRVRYESIAIEGVDENVQVVGFGPKFRMGSDAAAFYLPVGFGFGADLETSESWEIQPTFLMTNSSVSWLETTASVKGLFRFADEPDPRFAFNLGMGLGPDPRRVAIRPEAGVMFGPDMGGFNYHLSVGLSVGFGEPGPMPVVDDDLINGFAINDIQFKASFSEIVVTGEIVNRTGVDRARVWFEVRCTDPIGGVLVTTMFELSGLAAGVPQRFEVHATGSELDRVSRCRLRPLEDNPPTP